MTKIQFKDWKKISFVDAVHVNPKVTLKKGEFYPFVDMKAINPSTATVQEIMIKKLSSGGSRFSPMDTLMAKITPCLENGKIARYVPSAYPESPAFGSTEFIVIRGKEGVTDNDFAYYLTQWSEFRNFAIGQMTGSSGRQRVPVNSLAGFTFYLPPLPTQERIADILGSLDDKIELNRQMNETLEAMARALFKSWFVKFDPIYAKMEGRETPLPAEVMDLFPDALVESELGMIPQGWEVGRLGGIATNRRESVHPEDIASETEYIGLEHMPRRSIALDSWETAEKITSNKYSFIKRDILFGKLRPYFHKVGITPIDGICSTDIIVIEANEKQYRNYALLLVSSKDFVDTVSAAATGTKMPRTSWKYMKTYEMAVPSMPLLEQFDNLIEAMVEKIILNIHTTKKLSEIRDTLLPQLMSGEIEV